MLKPKINEGDREHFRYVFALGLSADDLSDFVQYFLPASTESSRLLTGIIQNMQSTFMSANCITWMSWNQREIDLSSCANWSGHEVLLPPQVIPVSLCCTSEIFCPLQRATMPLRLPLHPPWKAASRITSPSTRSSIACEHTPSVWATTYLTEPLYVSLIIFIIVMVQTFHFVYHHVLESPFIPSYTVIFISTKIHLYLRIITIALTNLTPPVRTA